MLDFFGVLFLVGLGLGAFFSVIWVIITCKTVYLIDERLDSEVNRLKERIHAQAARITVLECQKRSKK